uniref:Uncharacterized protein n=1 Tax=Solanum lycopersicum TaxID=4081 RepID=A0A494G8T4_SOLLC
MPSSPLGSTNGGMTSGVTYHNHPRTTRTVRRCRAWRDITALRQPHGRTMSGVVLNHCPWTARTVERRRAWHAIITFGKHRRWNDVRRGIPSSPLD